MPEILVRVVDKVHDDFYLNLGCTKRGDVIVAQPDGWPWGVEELSNPDWRIIKFPVADKAEHDALLVQFHALLSREMDIDPAQPSRTLQRRAFHLDLDSVSVPAAMAVSLRDAKRASPTFTMSRSPAVLTTLIDGLTKPRAPVVDPAIIGEGSPTVIGP